MSSLHDFRLALRGRWELRSSGTRPIGYAETSVTNCHYSLRNNSEERRSYECRRQTFSKRCTFYFIPFKQVSSLLVPTSCTWRQITMSWKSIEYPQNRPRRPRGGGDVQLYSSSNLNVRCGWVVKDTPRPRYPRERPGTHCIGAGWKPVPVWTDGKISPPTGFDHRTIQPVASSYTDWAIPPSLNYPKILGLNMLKWG
jgi:hypothetical protein